MILEVVDDTLVHVSCNLVLAEADGRTISKQVDDLHDGPTRRDHLASQTRHVVIATIRHDTDVQRLVASTERRMVQVEEDLVVLVKQVERRGLCADFLRWCNVKARPLDGHGSH
ncbi:hypothetical protein D3C71_1738190 [compost metagenome]